MTTCIRRVQTRVNGCDVREAGGGPCGGRRRLVIRRDYLYNEVTTCIRHVQTRVNGCDVREAGGGPCGGRRRLVIRRDYLYNEVTTCIRRDYLYTMCPDQSKWL